MKLDRLLLDVPRPRGWTMFSSSEISISASLPFSILSSHSIPAPLPLELSAEPPGPETPGIPKICVITIAPQHHSLAGIPVIEAERGSSEKLVPRETEASLNPFNSRAAELLAWKQKSNAGSCNTHPVIQHLWWCWVQRGPAILQKDL